MGSARTIMRGLNSGWPSPLTARDLPKIQALPRQPNDETRDVVLGHEVPHIRRQKQRLIDIPGAKVLAHSPSLNQTRWHLNSDYADRLLAANAWIFGHFLASPAAVKRRRFPVGASPTRQPLQP